MYINLKMNFYKHILFISIILAKYLLNVKCVSIINYRGINTTVYGFHSSEYANILKVLVGRGWGH